MISVVFFGSFQDYSVQILDRLHRHPEYQITAVITTPPRPGDKNIITKTAVQEYCESKNIPVFPLESLNTIPNIPQPDFIVVAGYGQLINDKWLNFPKIMAINIHPSLLPNYAGRFPAEWAILNGEKETGTTLIQMSQKFDQGNILAQTTIPLLPTDTKEIIYQKLYDLSATLLLDTLPKIINQEIISHPQIGKGFYARQLTREDGHLHSLTDLDKKIRALNPWPGVWTHILSKDGQSLKMKIFSAQQISEKFELQKVQIEGKKPTFWSEISSYYSLDLEK
jgi:methionyl-tRNA formyltransferase